MKISAAGPALSSVSARALVALGQRVSVARRLRHLTQPQLAELAGLGLSTVVSIERGAPTVQIGLWFNVLSMLELLDATGAWTGPARDLESSRALNAELPRRIRGTDRRAAPLTTDQQAVLVMTDAGLTPDARKRALDRLLTTSQHLHGMKCPDCASADTEDNGARRRDELTFRCRACNHQWDAEPA